MDYVSMEPVQLVDTLHELDKRKDDLARILRSGNRFGVDFYESLTHLGCRLCMGEPVEQVDAKGKKWTSWKGQPLIGTELPCRSCRHLRSMMVGKTGFQITV